MRYRLSIVVLVLIAGAGLLYLGARAVLEPMEDAGEPASPRGQLSNRPLTDEEFERRRESLMRRHLAKDQAVRELLAGRLTLLQAAARFRDAEAAVPASWTPPVRADAGDPAEGERLCRDVITRVHDWLATNLPEHAAEITARLEAELRRLRGEDGVVRLPD